MADVGHGPETVGGPVRGPLTKCEFAKLPPWTQYSLLYRAVVALTARAVGVVSLTAPAIWRAMGGVDKPPRPQLFIRMLNCIGLRTELVARPRQAAYIRVHMAALRAVSIREAALRCSAYVSCRSGKLYYY